MTKFEKRNAAYVELSKIANSNVRFQYINEVLHIGDIPVTDKNFIEIQERMWASLEYSADCQKARSE